MSAKSNIRDLSRTQIADKLVELKEKPFRAGQVYEWLWKKNAAHFEEMTNLSVGLREKLDELYHIDHLVISDEQVSADKTIKCAFRTTDGHIVEGVLIPTSTRMTACISSQVGCSLACEFCATGRLKMLRNLSAGEIVDQVVHLKQLAEDRYGLPLTNIVYMGMGEPLLNYKNVLRSTELISSPDGLGISPKRLTISTAGIAKMIRKLADDQVKFNLALSLHAANDKKRSEIMEINDSNNLASLSDALQYFNERTGTRVTFEYIIFRDFNDAIEDAAELAEFTKCVPCKINIIEYNPIDDGKFFRADATKTNAFASFLQTKNLVVNVRRSRGKDIDAACGQLANKNKAILKIERSMKNSFN